MAVQPFKVLLIEDDPDQIMLYQTKFTMEKIPFLATREGTAGIEIAKKEKPDIILLDVLMYEMNGVDVLRKLKADPETKDIPVIMMTNLSKKETAQESLSLGAIDYIIKTDIEPRQLVEKIRHILGK